MKVVYTKNSARIVLTAKVTEDHLKLFIDAELMPPAPAAPPQPDPAAPATPAVASQPTAVASAVGAPSAAAAPPAGVDKPYIPDPPITRAELGPLFEPVFNLRDMDQKVLDDVAVHLSRGEKVTDRRVRKGDAAEAGHDGKLLLLVRKFTGTGEIFTDEERYT
ncbi:MAG: hypothetical protein EBV03_13805, partial [Proteobacteria bacterium]|nr:hypothetical protein [Pseudomonadota bacterium]